MASVFGAAGGRGGGTTFFLFSSSLGFFRIKTKPSQHACVHIIYTHTGYYNQVRTHVGNKTTKGKINFQFVSICLFGFFARNFLKKFFQRKTEMFSSF